MTCSLCAEPQRYQSCQRQFQHSLLVCSGATSADFRGQEGRIKAKKKKKKRISLYTKMLQSNTDEQVLACFPETQPSFLSPFAWTDPCSELGSRLVRASAPAITLGLTTGTITAADGRGWRHRRILTSQREFLVLTEKRKNKQTKKYLFFHSSMLWELAQAKALDTALA